MQTGQVEIKQAGRADAALIRSLSVATFRETFATDNSAEDMDAYIAKDMSLPQLTGELEDSGNLFCMAWRQDTAIGYCKLRTTRVADTPPNCVPIEIERLYVLKAYHKTGTGAALMKHCTTYGVANGYDTVWLGVWEHNHRAINFYEQWGFEQFGTHIFRLGSDVQTDVLMKRGL